MLRRLWLVALVVCLAACGSDSPTQPSGPATRVINVSGNLDFQATEIGTEKSRTFTVRNTGNSALAVTGLTSNNTTNFSAGPLQFTVSPNAEQIVTVVFRPTALIDYTGTISVTSDATSGGNTIAYAGNGFTNNPIWTRSGQGNQVFDMPTYIRRVRIQGVWNQTQTSNFIVRISGSVEVNEILRDAITYDGTHNVIGGPVEITSSNQISWTFTEIR